MIVKFSTPFSFETQPMTRSQKACERIDDYFFLKGRKACIFVENKSGKAQYATLHHMTSPWYMTALKVLSYFTIICPLVMLLAKAIARLLMPITTLKNKVESLTAAPIFTSAQKLDLSPLNKFVPISVLSLSKDPTVHNPTASAQIQSVPTPTLHQSLLANVISSATLLKSPQLASQAPFIPSSLAPTSSAAGTPTLAPIEQVFLATPLSPVLQASSTFEEPSTSVAVVSLKTQLEECCDDLWNDMPMLGPLAATLMKMLPVDRKWLLECAKRDFFYGTAISSELQNEITTTLESIYKPSTYALDVKITKTPPTKIASSDLLFITLLVVTAPLYKSDLDDCIPFKKLLNQIEIETISDQFHLKLPDSFSMEDFLADKLSLVAAVAAFKDLFFPGYFGSFDDFYTLAITLRSTNIYEQYQRKNEMLKQSTAQTAVSMIVNSWRHVVIEDQLAILEKDRVLEIQQKISTNVTDDILTDRLANIVHDFKSLSSFVMLYEETVPLSDIVWVAELCCICELNILESNLAFVRKLISSFRDGLTSIEDVIAEKQSIMAILAAVSNISLSKIPYDSVDFFHLFIGLKQISILDAKNLNVTPDFSDNRHLESLWIEDCAKFLAPPNVANCPKLKELYLRRNGLVDAPDLRNNTDLRTLRLDHNNISIAPLLPDAKIFGPDDYTIKRNSLDDVEKDKVRAAGGLC